MTDSADSICFRLERLRTDLYGDRGKSKMARELGIRPSTYDRYERDRVPPADLLVKIASVANVTLEWLITGEGPRRPPQHLDREGVELTRRFEEAISLDAELRPVARAFLNWLDDRRMRPESTPHRFEVPTSDPVAIRPESDSSLETMAGEHGRTPGTAPTPGSASTPGTGGQSAPGSDDPDSSSAGTASSDFLTPDSPAAVDRETSPSEMSATAPGRFPSEDEQSVSANQLIPIIGRTAAGPARYWSDLATSSAAALDESIRYLLATAGGVSSDQLPSVETEASDIDSLTEASLVQLADSPSGPLEFLVAPDIKDRFPRAIAWQVDGDSMEPRYFHGDLVVVSENVPAVEGQPCVARQRGQIGVNCKVFHREGDSIVLIPINPRVEVQRVHESEVLSASRVLFVVRRSRN